MLRVTPSAQGESNKENRGFVRRRTQLVSALAGKPCDSRPPYISGSRARNPFSGCASCDDPNPVPRKKTEILSLKNFQPAPRTPPPATASSKRAATRNQPHIAPQPPPSPVPPTVSVTPPPQTSQPRPHVLPIAISKLASKQGAKSPELDFDDLHDTDGHAAVERVANNCSLTPPSKAVETQQEDLPSHIKKYCALVDDSNVAPSVEAQDIPLNLFDDSLRQTPVPVITPLTPTALSDASAAAAEDDKDAVHGEAKYRKVSPRQEDETDGDTSGTQLGLTEEEIMISVAARFYLRQHSELAALLATERDSVLEALHREESHCREFCIECENVFQPLKTASFGSFFLSWVAQVLHPKLLEAKRRQDLHAYLDLIVPEDERDTLAVEEFTFS